MTDVNSYKYRQLLSCKCLRIRQASRVITQFYDKKLRATGIKITQLAILSSLASGRPYLITELSKDLYIDRTTLTRSLAILKKQGVIENVKSPDGRHKKVKITSKGFEILNDAIPLWLEAEDEVYDLTKKYNLSLK
ncbi:MAG: MarR family transcriptional regulator [Rickettsiales bacterium]|nr:MarR family transcriptional regulator [Rickettsiales bacterium]|tara:strand:- start:58 stop:465 length:408 start_codon:yes stop_codon:yes gene_type:complete